MRVGRKNDDNSELTVYFDESLWIIQSFEAVIRKSGSMN
jgi:hypothetical protein